MPFRTSYLCLFTLLALPASADVLYTNGAVNGYLDAYIISGGANGDVVSDSFTLASDSTVIGVSNIGIWTDSGVSPGDFHWALSTAAFAGGTVEASGTGYDTSTEVIADNGLRREPR